MSYQVFRNDSRLSVQWTWSSSPTFGSGSHKYTKEKKQVRKKSLGKSHTTSSYQHSRPQIKLVEKLRDKNMYLQHTSDIFLFHIPKDINKPLEVFMWRAYPQKVHLIKNITF